MKPFRAAARPAGTHPRLTVLHSLSAPNGTTRYIDQIVGGAPPEVTVKFFSWREAFLGRYDILHLHWPEFMIRDPNPVKAFLRRGALQVLLVRCRMLRTPVVRTVHNLRPHEEGRPAERKVLAATDRQTAVFIRLNPTTKVDTVTKVVTIAHGHYRDRFAAIPCPAPVSGRLLYFGLIRPYKGVETLLSVFRNLVGPNLQLRIVGRPSYGLGAIVENALRGDDRITACLRYVSDDELVAEVGRAEIVVLPYREMHNSGSVLVALSLNRPVLVPDSASNRALAVEVGAGWVHTYQGELSVSVIEKAFADLRQNGSLSRPRLDGRDWKTIGWETYRTYLDARRCRHPDGDGAALPLPDVARNITG